MTGDQLIREAAKQLRHCRRHLSQERPELVFALARLRMAANALDTLIGRDDEPCLYVAEALVNRALVNEMRVAVQRALGDGEALN